VPRRFARVLLPVSFRLGQAFGRADLDGGGLHVLAPRLQGVAIPPRPRNLLSATSAETLEGKTWSLATTP
jgi:hypothetical protein